MVNSAKKSAISVSPDSYMVCFMLAACRDRLLLDIASNTT